MKHPGLHIDDGNADHGDIGHGSSGATQSSGSDDWAAYSPDAPYAKPYNEPATPTSEPTGNPNFVVGPGKIRKPFGPGPDVPANPVPGLRAPQDRGGDQ